MLVLLCAFILTACSSTPGYNEQLESWVGVSEEHLVDNWGMPDSTFTLDADTRVLTYVEYDGEGDREVYSEQIYYPAISGQNFPGPNPDGENIEYCKISFTVDNSVVTGYNFNGDDCAGKLLVRRRRGRQKNA